MNMQRIYPRDINGQSVVCCACGTRARLIDCYADLDGVPFESYYHYGCLTVHQVNSLTRKENHEPENKPVR